MCPQVYGIVLFMLTISCGVMTPFCLDPYETDPSKGIGPYLRCVCHTSRCGRTPHANVEQLTKDTSAPRYAHWSPDLIMTPARPARMMTLCGCTCWTPVNGGKVALLMGAVCKGIPAHCAPALGAQGRYKSCEKPRSLLERFYRELCLHHRVLVLPQHAGKGTQLSLVTAPAVAVASATDAHTVRAVRALGRANAGAAQLLYRGDLLIGRGRPVRARHSKCQQLASALPQPVPARIH